MLRRLLVPFALLGGLGFTGCNGVPVAVSRPCAGLDLQTSHDHCGTCGHACLAGESCAAGACVKPDVCAALDLQTSHDHCGTCARACLATETCRSGQCEAPLEVAFLAPADGAHVLPRFEVHLRITATGAVDTVTVTAPGALSSGVSPADPNGLLTATSTGELVLTATVTQGARTAVVTRKVIVDPSPLNPVVDVGGFYLGTDTVTLAARFPAGVAPATVEVRAKGGSAALAALDAPDADGSWRATFPAASAGRGDVTLELFATDATGLTGSRELTITVGLLHDTDCGPGCPMFIRPLTTPSGEGAVHLARVVASVGLPAQGTGDLRFTRFGGGATTTLTAAACPETAGATTVLAADGSRVAFVTHGAGPAATYSGYDACTHLATSVLPPGAGAPEELTATFDGDATVSLDGSVVVWAEREEGGPRVWKAWSPGVAAFVVAVGESPERVIPMKGAVVIIDRSPAPSVLVQATGAETIKQLDRNGALVEFTLATNFGGPRVSASGRSLFGAQHDYETNPAVWLHLPSATALTGCATVDGCNLANREATVLALQGDAFVVETLDWADHSEHVRFVDAATGRVQELGHGRIEGSWSQAGDASAALVVEEETRAVLITPAGDRVVLADGLSNGFGATCLNWQAWVHAAEGRFAFSSPLVLTPFERPGNFLVADDGHLFGKAPGAAAARLDSDAFPYRSGPLSLTADGAHLVYATTARHGIDPGELWTVPTAGGTPVRLVPPGLPDALGVLPPGNDAANSAVHQRSASLVVFAVPGASPDLNRLYVAHADGSSVAPVAGAIGAAAPDAAQAFGVDVDGGHAFWFDATRHLRVQPLAGGAVADYGPFGSSSVGLLPGGVVVGRLDDPTGLTWWAWAGPVHPVPALMVPSGGNEGVDLADHGRAFYVQGLNGGGPLWVVDAQGGRQLQAEGSGAGGSGLALRFGLATDGALFVAGLRSNDAPGLAVEQGGADGSVQAVAARDGLPVPTAAGFFTLDQRDRRETWLAGARPRGGFSYRIDGGARAGWYLWTVRDRRVLVLVQIP